MTTKDLPYLSRLSPSLQKTVLVTVLGILAAGALFTFGILAANRRLKDVQTEIGKLRDTLIAVRADIAGTEAQQEKTDTLAAEHHALLAAGALEPLLGSLAMRGKSLVDPLAIQTGFVIDSVKELTALPIRVPSPSPRQLYNRQPIEFTGHGSFAQITAFISLTEATHPLATLSSLLIVSQPSTPEVHKAIIAFEWPAKGEKIAAPAAKPKK